MGKVAAKIDTDQARPKPPSPLTQSVAADEPPTVSGDHKWVEHLENALVRPVAIITKERVRSYNRLCKSLSSGMFSFVGECAPDGSLIENRVYPSDKIPEGTMVNMRFLSMDESVFPYEVTAMSNGDGGFRLLSRSDFRSNVVFQVDLEPTVDWIEKLRPCRLNILRANDVLGVSVYCDEVNVHEGFIYCEGVAGIIAVHSAQEDCVCYHTEGTNLFITESDMQTGEAVRDEDVYATTLPAAIYEPFVRTS